MIGSIREFFRKKTPPVLSSSIPVPTVPYIPLPVANLTPLISVHNCGHRSSSYAVLRNSEGTECLVCYNKRMEAP